MARRKTLRCNIICGVVLTVLSTLLLLHMKPNSSKILVRKKSSVPSEYMDELIQSKHNKSKGKIESNYLIYTKGCRIKRPTIEEDRILTAMILKEPGSIKVNSSNLITVSYVKDSTLYVNNSALVQITREQNINAKVIRCCYRVFSRGIGRKADYTIRYDSNCFDFENSVKVKVEMFRVECRSENIVIYQYAHAVVQVKEKVEAKCKKAERKFKLHDDHLSVVIIGIEGTSNQNFHRFMKKTSTLLSNQHSIDFEGLTSVGENTYPNLIPLLTSLSSKEFAKAACRSNRSSTFDNCHFLWDAFSTYGFRTAYIEDLPQYNLFASRGGFIRPPTDYYLRPIFLANQNSSYGNDNRSSSKVRDTISALNFTSDLVEKFKRKNFFIFAWLSSLSHGNMLNAPVLDDLLHKFLMTLIDKNLLNNTLLVLMSDHGARYGTYRQTISGWSEAKRPLLNFLFPKWFQNKYSILHQNIIDSSRSLVTNYDLHETFKDVLFHEYYRQHLGRYIDTYEDIILAKRAPLHYKLYKYSRIKGISLFKILPENRNCDRAFVPPSFCPCYSVHDVSHQSEFVPAAVEAIMTGVNSITKPVRNLCANLTLKSLMDVRILVPNDSSDQYNVMFGKNQQISPVRYMIVFTTTPGNAVFESNFDLDSSTNKPKHVNVLRVNKINHLHSKCVTKSLHKLFCACTKQYSKSRSKIR